MTAHRKELTYKDSGVDIDLGEAFVKRIAPMAASTRNMFSMDSIGSFAGMVNLGSRNWKEPLIVACTDGVGTKLKLAFALNQHHTVGIDLVAMSINDLLVTGAQPVAFLDYLATSKLDLNQHGDVVQGIADGCRISECVLLGGETAELPGFYSDDEYDLAGFAIGVVEKDDVLSPENVTPGDVLIGLPSSGLHSNGYSLARKVFETLDLHQSYGNLNSSLGEVLLKPTRIYSQEMKICREITGVKSIAHITGGGIPGNLPRALPGELGAAIDRFSWPLPEIFKMIQKQGNVREEEMFRTFNMGLGMIIVVSQESERLLCDNLRKNDLDCYRIGHVTSESGVTWRHSSSENSTNQPTRPIADDLLNESIKTVEPLKLAILGSGRGSNMESICNAIDCKKLNARIQCVISNHSKAKILDKARSRNIPAYHLSSYTHPENEADALIKLLKKHQVTTVVLAGYMKKLPVELVNEFDGNVLNIHPALLPAFGGKGMYGMNVHKAVIASGAKFSGVTVHVVDNEYDTGRILDQRIVSITRDDTPETLAAKVLKEEHDLYWRVIENHHRQFLADD